MTIQEPPKHKNVSLHELAEALGDWLDTDSFDLIKIDLIVAAIV
jgi:hypothetical protein